MKVKNIFLGLLTAILFFSACKKTDVEASTRLFRPVVTGSLSTINNSIVATWSNIKAAATYQVQVSRDTFRTIDVTMSIDTNTIQVNGLKWDQLYQIQVKAIATDTALNSRWSSLGEIKVPKFPSILKAQTIADVTDEAIRVSWTNTGATVTNIKLLRPSDSSLVRDVPLTNIDVTNQYKIITGLAANTTYIVMIYSSSTLRGYDNFTTKAALTGTIVDLRNITDRPSVLADTLPLVDAGATILLKRGFTYNLATTVSLSKAVTIQSGTDLTVTDPAIVYFTSNFNFVAGATIDYIDFKDVVLRGSDYAARYVFNTTNSANLGRMSFENCKVEIFRGIVRLQTGTTAITNFVVNNCILDSLSGYGVITVDNITCRADNISIRNSTLYKVEKIVTSRSNSVSVLIENCSINEGPLAGNYVIDYSTSPTNNVSNGIKLNNCIIGIAKNFGVGVRGIRAGTTTSSVVTNTYNTSDFTVAATTPFPIPDIIPYPKKSTEIWQDPINGNFKLTDATLILKNVGDPRWK